MLNCLALADGQRPPRRDPDDSEPGDFRHGWQHETSSRVKRQHREVLLPRLTDSERAMLRSQSGPLAGVPLSTTPSHSLNRFPLVPGPLAPPLAPPSPSICTSVSVWPTTELHVPQRGCCGASQWRVQVFGFAEKLEGELFQTPCCVSSTRRHLTPVISADWKSWLMGCRSLEERSWQSTRRWFLLCIATGPLIHARQMRMVLF